KQGAFSTAGLGQDKAMTPSMTNGISVRQIRSSRNAATAASLAAFIAAGNVPPTARARYASEIHGKRSKSGASKWSFEIEVKSSGGSVDGCLSGYVSAYWIA